MRTYNQSSILFKKGKKHLVGAVNSPVRAFNSVGGNPIFIDHAKASKIYDVDQNEYIDFVLSYGPMILGHQHKKVAKAIGKTLSKGYTFGASTEKEIELAEIVANALPGVDKVRFVNSGTEAVFSALRLARAYTKKSKIIKFVGCYHGHADSLLVQAGSGLATLSMPTSAGVPKESVRNTLVANYNDIESVKALFKKHDDIAAAIIEPVTGNMGVVLPQNNFLKKLHALLKKNDALLIADEVMTGFRAKFGAAIDFYDVKPDIFCLGKVIGGGFPVGAYAASNKIMNLVAPLGNMYQAGTLSGNPIAMAAGISTLKELKKSNPYPFFNKVGKRLKNTFKEASKQNNIPIQVNHFGSMINPFFTNKKVRNFDDVKQSHTHYYKVFFWEMMNEGIFLPPSAFESWFLCTTLTKKEIKHTQMAIHKAIKKLSTTKF